MLKRLKETIQGQTSQEHTQKAWDLLSKSGYARYLRELKSGGLKIDRGTVRWHERLDGKYVLMTNDLETPAEEPVLGYSGHVARRARFSVYEDRAQHRAPPPPNARPHHQPRPPKPPRLPAGPTGRVPDWDELDSAARAIGADLPLPGGDGPGHRLLDQATHRAGEKSLEKIRPRGTHPASLRPK